MGHRLPIKGGYPSRRQIHCKIFAGYGSRMEEQAEVEVHHHEVAAPVTRSAPPEKLVKRADWLQILKYTVHNVAHSYGKTATFMPKPIVGDNGSGMHVHQSVWKEGQNLFAGNGYAGLSEFALYYIGGIIKHAKALNAITNPGTNSYKRLVPGFEAPINLAYSAKNRSASIRIPFVSSPKARRIEVRFLIRHVTPIWRSRRCCCSRAGWGAEQDPPGRSDRQESLRSAARRGQKVPNVCSSLEQALTELNKDRAFLTKGGVFSDDMLDAYIDLKMEEVTMFRMTTHPVEYAMYYSL
jgi:glutamine synthetase